MSRYTKMSSLLVTLVLLLAGSANAEMNPVVVKVYAQHVGPNIVYQYQVTNNSENRVTAVRIGHRYDIRDRSNVIDERQLLVLPAGLTDLDEGTPANSKTSPGGWRGDVVAQEENEYHLFEWSVESGQAGILPGQTLSGFSVALSESDQTYLNSYFSVTFASGQVRTYSAPMKRIDTTPPVLSISIHPSELWPPNGQPVVVLSQIVVADDYDGQPELSLESIVANETLASEDVSGARYGTDDRQFALAAKRDGQNKTGRIYTIAYSATDASGNKSTASATVTVPHDQRAK